MDSATGTFDGDYSCAEVVDREMGMQCAELHGHLPPAEFARRVVELARTYNNALVVAERNGVGQSVVEHLKMSDYENFYVEKGDVGFTTTVVNRPAMVENLVKCMSAEPQLFSSVRFLRECRTFVRHPDREPSAAAGAHDDTVMAMAIAMHVRNIGRRNKRSNGAALE